MCMLFSVPLSALAFAFIARREEKIIGRSLGGYSSYVKLLIYGNSTLIGEHIAPTTSSRDAWATR